MLCKLSPEIEALKMRRAIAALLFSLVVSGCASVQPPVLYYDQDDLGRYYKTEEGTHLRVDPDGTVRMIWDGKDPLRPPRILGQVSKAGEGDSWDWDMSQYSVVNPTGVCTNVFTGEPGISCGNLAWEIPAGIVAAPFYVLLKALELRVGLLQSRQRMAALKDLQTCSIQKCSEEELRGIQQRISLANALDALVYGRRQRSPSGGGMSSADGFLGSGFLGPGIESAYGPGVHSDATGRPFIWTPDFGGPALGPITPNAYGPGIGMDGTGRPVRPSCPPGHVMC
jgi:hypothetical protein